MRLIIQNEKTGLDFLSRVYYFEKMFKEKAIIVHFLPPLAVLFANSKREIANEKAIKEAGFEFRRTHMLASEYTLYLFHENVPCIQITDNRNYKDSLLDILLEFGIKAYNVKNDIMVDGKKLAGFIKDKGQFLTGLSFSKPQIDIDSMFNLEIIGSNKNKPSSRITSVEDIIGKLPTREEIIKVIAKVFNANIVDLELNITKTNEYKIASSFITSLDWLKNGAEKYEQVDKEGKAYIVFKYPDGKMQKIAKEEIFTLHDCQD